MPGRIRLSLGGVQRTPSLMIKILLWAHSVTRSAAVEDRFLAALFDAALVSDDTWNQVQRLDVAVQETGVLHRDQAESLIKWNQVARNSKKSSDLVFTEAGGN